jgi:hypothetical protein
LGGDQNHPDVKVCTIYSEDMPTSTWGPEQIFCKLTAGSCLRPDGWCHHGGSNYLMLDCDGDGVADPYCKDVAGQSGFRSSANHCADTWPQGVCQECTITLFQHGDFGGWHAVFPKGTFNMADIVARGGQNDDVSSVKVGQNCAVTFYEHDNYNGYSITFPPGDYNMADMMNAGFKNDELTSINVFPESDVHADGAVQGEVEAAPSQGGEKVYLAVGGNFPQNANVASFCPAGTTYVRHVCGTGAPEWTGSQEVQYGPYSSDDYLASDPDTHCMTECNCDMIKVECQAPLLQYVMVEASYPQEATVGSFCPAGTIYSRHVCGEEGDVWTGSQAVSFGPYSSNDFLTTHGHCSCCCDCEHIKVECAEAAKQYVSIVGQYPQNKYVEEYCPSGTTYKRHVCGQGATEWTGTQEVEFGPYSTNEMLDESGHCQKECDCEDIKIECEA